MKITDVKLPAGLVLSRNAIKVMKDFISRTYEIGEPITIEQIVQEYEILLTENRLHEAMEYGVNTYEKSDELRIKDKLRAELVKENRRQILVKNADKMLKNIKNSDSILGILKMNIVNYTFLKLKKQNNKKASNEIQSILRAYPRLRTYADEVERDME